jgi:hypothetical protein
VRSSDVGRMRNAAEVRSLGCFCGRATALSK